MLAAPPSYLQTAQVRELLLVMPRIGPARADRLLAGSRIAHAKTVAGLSERQRTELVRLLGR
jgi:S13-like protein